MIATDQLLQTRVIAASPYRLHLMVVDTAIGHTRSVLSAFETRDFELSHQAAGRARECVNELLAGLRSDPAPELVSLVKTYFLQIEKCLAFADLLQDAEAGRKALELLEGYRDTWVQLNERLK